MPFLPVGDPLQSRHMARVLRAWRPRYGPGPILRFSPQIIFQRRILHCQPTATIGQAQGILLESAHASRAHRARKERDCPFVAM